MHRMGHTPDGAACTQGGPPMGRVAAQLSAMQGGTTAQQCSARAARAADRVAAAQAVPGAPQKSPGPIVAAYVQGCMRRHAALQASWGEGEMRGPKWPAQCRLIAPCI